MMEKVSGFIIVWKLRFHTIKTLRKLPLLLQRADIDQLCRIRRKAAL